MSNVTALKEARTSVKEAAHKYKSAMEGGELSPDEVAQKALEVVDLALKLEDIAEGIASGVPSEGGESESMIDEEPVNQGMEEEPSMEPDTLPERVQTAMDEEKKEKHAMDDDNKEKRIAQLEKDNKDMKEAQIKQDLSLKYAQLFPEPMREAQRKVFLAHKESPRILQARLDEAQTLSKQAPTHYKTAQMDSPFTFDDTNNYDNTTDMGSLI